MNATIYRLAVKPPHIISLIVLSAFAAMGTVLMTPALPAIAQFFHISQGKSQLVVTVFLFGYAFGQLIYGPLSNRYGRKKALYIGIAIATIGSLFSISAKPFESFELLIIGRFIEAIGSSVGLVVSFTIINDFYFPDQARGQMALLTLAFAIVPGVATTLGGFITQWLGWQSCFYFLLAYGFVLLYPAIKLSETLATPDHHALHGRHLLRNYWLQLKNRKLMAYSIMFGLSTGCSYIFSAEGPFIGIHILGYSAGTYGLLGFIPFVGAVIGSIVNVKISTKVSAPTMSKVGYACELIAALSIFIFFALHYINLWTLLAPLTLFFFGVSTLASNFSILGSNATEDKANGSAVMMFSNMATAMLLTFILSISHEKGAIILPTIFLLALVLMPLIALLNFVIFKEN